MKTKLLFLALFITVGINAQTPFFIELTDAKPSSSASEWASKVKAPSAAWGSINERYSKTIIPDGLSKKWKTKAWRGQRVNGQAVFYTPKEIKNVTINSTPLKKGNSVIPSSSIELSFVRYVMTDELNKDKKGGCGYRHNKAEWDSSIVADILDASKSMPVEANSVRPVWINVWVPSNATPGTYKAELEISGEGMKTISLPYEITVTSRVLPEPKDWEFHLDLWQNPYSVARFYNVPLWSKEHFDYMRPIMERYAKAGGKVITVSILNRPWNGQTHDAFSSMVLKEKKIDGTWRYDYTVFDKWVEFMMSCGVTEQIDCYTVVPWALDFDYYDQATNSVKVAKANPGEPAYENYWIPFLKNFSKHLKEKGWLDRTAIAMDERSKEAMSAAEKVIFTACPDFKIAGAIHYYPDVEPNIYDLCLAYGETLPQEVLERRRKEGKITTCYTCCAEAYPNTYTFSAPAEATWIPLHSAAIDVDGYLRWAYNSWTEKPLQDSRFYNWAAGDCYLVYPNSSSIRFERLIEGIQYVEMIRILRKEFTDNNNSAKLKLLNDAVSKFVPMNLRIDNATQMVDEFKSVMDKL